MKLYQLRRLLPKIRMFLLLSFLLAGCGSLAGSVSTIHVSVVSGESAQTLEVLAGSTSRDALEQAGIEIDSLDRSDPPLYSVLQDGDTITFIQVEEEYIVEDRVVPYETQTLRNESLEEGEQRLIQPGQNGLEEVTYRVLYENGVETSKTVSGIQVVTAATPEIIMVGSQTPFSVVGIPGILAYISAGNAWVMRETTGVRQPIVTTGDLDGRIFKVSPNGRWLLYTRSGEDGESINSLWISAIDSGQGESFDLGIENIIHFADWVPGTSTGIVYSTAELNPGPPGWQANNDLVFINFSEESGWTTSPRETIEPNLGGLYGWWGTDFRYSSDGEELAYSRPDGFGIVDLDYNFLLESYSVLAVQTRSDWAWIPPIAWSPDGNFIYFVDHRREEGLPAAEESQIFDLSVFPLIGGGPVALVRDVGMFAYPLPSPQRTLDSGEVNFQVAFLQAVEPRRSRTSGYQLMVMDQDGSNVKQVFSAAGGQGFSPHDYYWLPWYAVDEYPNYLAIINQGDLWLVDAETGETLRLTGDGLVTAIDWK